MTAALAAVPNDEYITTDEFAKLLRTEASTVRYWRQIGKGPKGFRAGRRVLYSLSEVRKWIASLQEDEGR